MVSAGRADYVRAAPGGGDDAVSPAVCAFGVDDGEGGVGAHGVAGRGGGGVSADEGERGR